MVADVAACTGRAGGRALGEWSSAAAVVAVVGGERM